MSVSAVAGKYLWHLDVKFPAAVNKEQLQSFERGAALFSPTCSFQSDQLAGLGETSRTRNAAPQSDLARGSKSQHAEEIADNPALITQTGHVWSPL